MQIFGIFLAAYMFELIDSELHDLRSKISSTNVSVMNRNPTKVFTERGLYMLATILKSEKARDVTFAIIETFVNVRELKRELLDLHKETDKSKQASKMQHFGEVLTDMVIKITRSLSVRSHPPRSSGLSAPSRVALPECFSMEIDYYLYYCSPQGQIKTMARPEGAARLCRLFERCES